MNDVAPWLAALMIDAPMLGAVIGLLLLVCRGHWSQRGEMVALLGMIIGSTAAICLATILFLDPGGVREVSCSLGAGIWNGLNLEFGLRADLNSSIWVATISGLAAAITRHRNCAARQRNQMSEDSTAVFAVTMAILVAVSAGLTLSSSLMQMVICWMLLSPVTLMLVGSTSSLGSASLGMQRTLQVGLIGDLLLLWGVLLIEMTTGTDSLVKSFSAIGLQRLGADPALPGLIGALLVLSLVGRCGLFPAFGWHIAASEWKGDLAAAIYGIGLVPSATWVAIKCQPLIASSEIPLLLLGVLGTLGAILGLFVSCQQLDFYRRLAWLLSSQTGVILAGLGSGQPAAVSAGIWYQCAMSISAVVLFLSLDQGASRPATSSNRFQLRIVAVACAVFSIAGFFPGAGAWTQRVLVEVNMQPVSWGTEEESDDEPISSDVTEGTSQIPALQPGKPHWGWIGGIWLVQGLTAFSIAQVFQAIVRNKASEMSGAFVIESAALLLVLLAPCPWLLGEISIPLTTGELCRFAIGQVIAVTGLIIGSWLTAETTRSQVTNHVTMSPGNVAVRSPLEWIEQAFLTNWIEQIVTRLAGRCLAWVGSLAELLHVEHVEFLLVIPLLGTSVLLLTLFLIGK